MPTLADTMAKWERSPSVCPTGIDEQFTGILSKFSGNVPRSYNIAVESDELVCKTKT